MTALEWGQMLECDPGAPPHRAAEMVLLEAVKSRCDQVASAVVAKAPPDSRGFSNLERNGPLVSLPEFTAPESADLCFWCFPVDPCQRIPSSQKDFGLNLHIRYLLDSGLV